MINKLNDKIRKSTEKFFPEKPVVFGNGNTASKIMMIGEAPGGKEEKQGACFVGSAGKNLKEFLKILDLKRENIYITNVVKIRPTKINPTSNRINNRPPNKEELKFFIPFLIEEINIIKPEFIVTLGNPALKSVFDNKDISISEFHGKLYQLNNFKVFPLYHPAAIIYNRNLKNTYIQDLKTLSNIIN